MRPLMFLGLGLFAVVAAMLTSLGSLWFAPVDFLVPYPESQYLAVFGWMLVVAGAGWLRERSRWFLVLMRIGLGSCAILVVARLGFEWPVAVRGFVEFVGPTLIATLSCFGVMSASRRVDPVTHGWGLLIGIGATGVTLGTLPLYSLLVTVSGRDGGGGSGEGAAWAAFGSSVLLSVGVTVVGTAVLLLMVAAVARGRLEPAQS